MLIYMVSTKQQPKEEIVDLKKVKIPCLFMFQKA